MNPTGSFTSVPVRGSAFGVSVSIGSSKSRSEAHEESRSEPARTYAQYMPTTINGMLDAKASAPTGMYKYILIPITNPKQSTASWLLDMTQFLQSWNSVAESAERLLNK